MRSSVTSLIYKPLIKLLYIYISIVLKLCKFHVECIYEDETILIPLLQVILMLNVLDHLYGDVC